MSNKTNLIWDLSGTLFRPSSEGLSGDELDQYSFIFLMWSGKKEVSQLDALALQVLSLLDKKLNATKPISYTHTGTPLPEIIRLNLAGLISSQEAWQTVEEFFNSWAPDNLSQEDAPKIAIMLRLFFNPLSLTRCMKPIPYTTDLLLKTIQKGTPHYILSNWDRDSFEPFYATWKDTILQPFIPSNIIISAQTGYVKPQKEIYAWFLTHTGLTPESCFFIDDQKENIAAAASVGIEGFHITPENIQEAQEIVQQHGLI